MHAGEMGSFCRERCGAAVRRRRWGACGGDGALAESGGGGAAARCGGAVHAGEMGNSGRERRGGGAVRRCGGGAARCGGAVRRCGAAVRWRGAVARRGAMRCGAVRKLETDDETGQAEQIFTAPDGAQYMFMMYEKGLPTERIAICEWLGTKRGCQLLQVSSKGLASEARAVIAGELMDMLVAGKSLEDLKARKLELLSAV